MKQKMYEPNIRTTEKLINYLNEVEDIRELLGTIPVLPIVEEFIQRQALVETVYYTARIEGNPLDIRIAERFRERETSKPNAESEQDYVNLYKVMDFIYYIANKVDIPIDEEVIKQIHAFVVRDIPSQGSPGVYKLKPNEIKDKVSSERIFLPPSPDDTPRLMSELSAWLSQKRLAIHPMITAGIAHLELVAIHPFDNGNGRTARALADLILCRYGYEFRHLFSWVRQIGIDIGTYHQKLRQALGPEYRANADPTVWLEYFTESIAKSLAELKPELLKIRDAFVNTYNMGTEAGLSTDQVEAIVFAEFHGSVTTAEYMRAKKFSRSTVVKRLSELVQLGLLQVEGKGRSVKYIPTKREATIK
jgi:Fic family protein